MEFIIKEKQKFNQLFIWIPLVLLLIFAVKRLYNETSISNIIPLLIVVIVIIFLWSITLKYSINKDEISISFFPFFKKKAFRKDDIEDISVVTYNPIFDFGGWGLRYGRNNTVAYNIRGNTGIYIVLKNGKKYLVGSQLDKKLLLEKLNIFFDIVNEKKF